MNRFLIFFLLAGCASTTNRVPEPIIKTEVVERLVPVMEPCSQSVDKPDDPLLGNTKGLESKIDRQLESDYVLRTYIFRLEIAFLNCGGK